MSRHTIAVCLLATLLLVSAPALALPTVNELLKMMAEQEAKINTSEADSELLMKMPEGTLHAFNHLTTTRTRVDGKTIRKVSVAGTSTLEISGKTVKARTRSVNDGRFEWHEVRITDPPEFRKLQVVKEKSDQKLGMLGTEAIIQYNIRELKSSFSLLKVEEATLDGRKIYVIEATPKPGQAENEGMAPMKLYLDQEHLTLRRVVTYDDNGEVFSRIDLTNIKINEPVDPKLFEYTPPPGAEVIDMTQDAPGQ